MNDDLPRAVASSSFTIFGVEVKCHVLDDGQRVIEADSMHALLGAMAESGIDGIDHDPQEFEEILRWLRLAGNEK